MLKGVTATVFNGSSFVGKNVLARLGKEGAQCVIAYRGDGYYESKYKLVGKLGSVYLQKYNLKDEDSLYEAMRYSDIVVNLIGKQTPTRNFSLQDVHVDGCRRVARIAREVGVKKFIHFSALNCSPNPEPQCKRKGSEFLKSKYYGELAVREEFPTATIFRPSDILGEQDDFLNHFTSFNRSLWGTKMPIWDYYYQVQKQPVYIRDVVNGVLQAILSNSAEGKVYQAVGPYRYDFIELLEYIRSCSGRGEILDEHQITNLRYSFLMQLVIYVTEFVARYPFISWERVERDLHSDFVDPKLPTLKDLGVDLTPLEQPIQILGDYRPRLHRYQVTYATREEIELPKRLNLALS